MVLPRPEVFAEIACGTDQRLEFERQVLSVFDRGVGFDVAWFGYADGPSSVAPGLLDSVRALCPERWAVYGQETERVLPAALAGGGVVVDREALGVAVLERLAIYQEMMRPHRGKCTALIFLQARGRKLGRLILGRAGRDNFSEAELGFLRTSVPVLSLALSSFELPCSQPTVPVGLPELTPREHEILGYLPLGYTNAQIALALGTAPRTVRNQLSRLFGKLGVGSRAEAAALAASMPLG